MFAKRSINLLKLPPHFNHIIRKGAFNHAADSREALLLNSTLARCFSKTPDPKDEEPKSFAEKMQSKIDELRITYKPLFDGYEFAKLKSQQYFYYVLALAILMYFYHKSNQRYMTFSELITTVQSENFLQLRIIKFVESDHIVNTRCEIKTEDHWYTCENADMDILAETLMHMKNKELIATGVSYKIKKTYHEYITSYSGLLKIAFIIFILTRLAKSSQQASKGPGAGIE